MGTQADFAAYVAQIGAGPRTALALHCTMAFSGAWAGFAKAAPDWRFIAPDMPSHGRSADWDEISDFSQTVFDSTVACLQGPTDIIGHSFGGAIALRIAVERPDLVRSLAMFEPVFFCAANDIAPDIVQRYDTGELGFLTALREGRREEAARLFNRMWSAGSPPWDKMPEGLRAAMTRAVHVVPDTAPFLYGDSAGVLDRLGQINAPTLIMRGEHSLDIVTATNKGLAGRIPGAQQAVIDGAGHMAPITHPKDVARVWLDFVG